MWKKWEARVRVEGRLATATARRRRGGAYGGEPVQSPRGGHRRKGQPADRPRSQRLFIIRTEEHDFRARPHCRQSRGIFSPSRVSACRTGHAGSRRILRRSYLAAPQPEKAVPQLRRRGVSSCAESKTEPNTFRSGSIIPGVVTRCAWRTSRSPALGP